MKIARYELDDGVPTWGVVDLQQATVTPIFGLIREWAPRFLEDGPDSLVAAGERAPLDVVTMRAPLEETSKIVGTGANYMAHLERLGVTEPPATTIAYFKPQSAIVDPGGTIVYPATTEQLDYEVELVAVVGTRINDPKRGSRDLLGYTVGNDISARDAQSPIGGPDLFSMKALDDSSPVGPWITTADELGAPEHLDVGICLRVNGEERQRDRTSNMLWSIDQILDYVVARTRLQAGDIIFTGTTAGVGAEDGRFLEPGDVVEAEIEGIGVLCATVGPRGNGGT